MDYTKADYDKIEEEVAAEVLGEIKEKRLDETLLTNLYSVMLALIDAAEKGSNYEGMVIGFKADGSLLYDNDLLKEYDTWCPICPSGDYSLHYKINICRGGNYNLSREPNGLFIKCYAIFNICCNTEGCAWNGNYKYQGHYINYFNDNKREYKSIKLYMVPKTLEELLGHLQEDGINKEEAKRVTQAP